MLFMQLPHRPALTTPFKMSWADNAVDTSALTRHSLSLLLCNVQGFRQIFSLPAAPSCLLSTMWHSVSRADSWPVAVDRMRTMKRFLHIWPILHRILWFFVYWLPPSIFFRITEVQNLNFKVCKSVHHRTIQINQPTRCNNFLSLLLDVYIQLNMFRASSRPSSGVQQLQ